MGLPTGICEMSPYGVVKLYEDLLEERTKVRPDLLAEGSKGKNLHGARSMLSLTGKEPARVKMLLQASIEKKGPMASMMYVAAHMVEVMYSEDVKKALERGVYVRAPAIKQGTFDEWEL